MQGTQTKQLSDLQEKILGLENKFGKNMSGLEGKFAQQMGQMTEQLKGIDLTKIKEAAKRKKSQQAQQEDKVYEVESSD